MVEGTRRPGPTIRACLPEGLKCFAAFHLQPALYLDKSTLWLGVGMGADTRSARATTDTIWDLIREDRSSTALIDAVGDMLKAEG